MQEIFFEETAELINSEKQSRKYKTFQILSYVMFGLILVWIFAILAFAFIDVDNPGKDLILLISPMVFLLIMGIIFGLLKNKFFVEYDYTFVSGSVKFAKIIARKKRKLFYKFETTKIEKIGHYDSETFNQYLKVPSIKVVYMTPNKIASEGKSLFYMVVNHEKGKKLMVLECSKTFIVSVIRYTGMMVLERGFK